jgi:hypothetical protein
MKYGFVVLAMFASASLALAGPLYFQGFESDVSGWYIDSGGDGNGSITQTASGGGPLGVNAADGSFYATVHNNTEAYSDFEGCCSGYGTGGYSLFGGSGSGFQSYPGAPFYQSMDVYIDPTLTQPVSYGQAFWIDAAPSSTDPNDYTGGNDGTGYGAEHNFRLAYGAGAVNITVDGETTPLYTITTAGWFDFQFLYSQSDSNPTDLSTTTLSILTPGGTSLASESVNNNADGETLQNQYLAGPNYLWLTVWQNGFSGDNLAIDDVTADTTATPEPSSVLLLGAGIVAVGLLARRRAV